MKQVGYVRRLVLNKNFGFIESNGQDDIFFHKEDCCENTSYNALIVGEKVEFLMDETPKGPRARDVETYNE